MASTNHDMTNHWNSQTGFLMAAIGGAIGLGNIWRFPFEAGQNGGAAFIIIYFAFIIIIGFPLLSAETMLGRYGKQGAVTLFGHVAKKEGKSNHWRYIGWFIASSAFITCSYYSVIAGTTGAYTYEALTGSLSGITPEGATELYDSYQSSPIKLALWHGLFMVTCGIILSKQLNDGIEKITSIAMPIFFVLLISLIIIAAIIGDFAAGVKFLLQPDFSKVTIEVVISALGQAFFSTSIALGIMLTFGAYLPREISIVKSTFIICIADTMVAMLAGLCIFPIVFGFGMEPGQGTGLVFKTMTVAFGQLEYGSIVALAFFFLLSIAGITSLIAMMETMVSYLNKFHEMSRKKSAIMVSGSIFVVGLLSAFSSNILSAVKVFDMDFLTLFDWWVNHIGLPLGGLLMAIFVGWVIKKQNVMEAYGKDEKWIEQIYFIIRYVSPIAVSIILISQFLL
jgi:neurotransmitter:Na+ symporter, NSS family